MHHYWVLSNPIEPQLFRDLQRRIAAVMAAACPGSKPDQSLDDPSQVMRVAGHHLPSEDTIVNETSYSRERVIPTLEAAEEHSDQTRFRRRDHQGRGG